ncbi:ABC transporter substrate-binding protein [Chloroflexota bacterium]
MIRMGKGSRMKKCLMLFVVFMLAASVVTGCGEKEEPTPTAVEAGFAGAPLSGLPGLQVNFIDQSTGQIDTWAWDFGDGGTSSERNPSHTYDTVGQYTVALAVTGPGGSDTETKTNYVEVGEIVADFTGSPLSDEESIQVQFTDKSLGEIDTWEWDFGDGSTSTEQNPSHTYDAIGEYTVTLKVTGPKGWDSETKSNYIKVTPPVEPTGSLTVAMSTLGAGFLPWYSQGVSTARRVVLAPMADWLTYVKHDGEEIIPGLAESWDISEDNMSITFHLREGVQFHDGWGELTSEDVVYTYEKIVSPGSLAGLTWLKQHVESVEAPGPYEFTIHLLDPVAYLIPRAMSTASGVSICCKAYVEDVGEDVATDIPIFSGPYEYVEEMAGGYLKLQAVEDHWRVVPEYENLIFIEVPEEMTRVAMLKSGEADIIETSTGRARSLEDQGYDATSVHHAFTIGFYLLGQWFPEDTYYDPDLPWLDQNVRKAMNLAINREEMAEQIYYGLAEPCATHSYFPWSDEFEPYPYDPVLAAQLLEDAGYGEGFNVEMWILAYPGQAAEITDLTMAVVGYWEAIGIECSITSYDATAVWGRIMQHNTTGVCFGYGTIRYAPLSQGFGHWDATQFFFPLGSNATIDALLAQVDEQMSLEDRYDVVEQMSQTLYDGYIPVPLLSADMMWVKNGDDVGDWVTITSSNWTLNWEYIVHPTPLNTFRLWEP